MAPEKQIGEQAGAVDQSSGPVFTESETKMISFIFKNSPPSFKVAPNWEAVRQDLGSASIEATKKRFKQISQKRGWFEAAGTTPATPDPKKTPAARSSTKKKKKFAETDDNSDGSDEVSPAKKHKTGPK